MLPLRIVGEAHGAKARSGRKIILSGNMQRLRNNGETHGAKASGGKIISCGTG
jgi:hypothetical protein